MQWPQPGYNHTPAYQTAGLPYLTSSTAAAGTPVYIQFPYVTRTITVGATGGATTRCICKEDQVKDGDTCIFCGKQAKHVVYFGKAY